MSPRVHEPWWLGGRVRQKNTNFGKRKLDVFPVLSDTLTSMVHEKNRFQVLLGVAQIKWNFWKYMGVKKSKWNSIKWGPKICWMMRGFQIWPQNSSRITFDPLFGQKNYQKWAKYDILPTFDSFFTKKGQILSDLNSEVTFIILSSFCIF